MITILKRLAAGWLSLAVILAGCSAQVQTSEQEVQIITSFYPLYDFAMQIGGEHVSVTNMVPAGTDPHDWSPRSQDMILMSKGDLFIYNGAGFDDWWVDDFLGSLREQEMPHVVVASDGIDLISAGGVHADDHDHEADEHEHDSNEHNEAHHHEDEHLHDDEHQHEDEHAHDAANEHEDDHAHEEAEHEHHAAHEHEEQGEHGHSHHHGQYDPHVWLSPLSAMQMAENIKNGLVAVDPEHAADYEANYARLIDELTALHEDYTAVTANAPRKQFVTSHEAFAYLARDYGLEQLAVMGLAADAEPTSQDLKRIADFIAEHDVKYIMMEELAPPKIAETLAADLGIEILTLNPIEGLTKAQQTEGESYISLMRHNLHSLELALYE